MNRRSYSIRRANRRKASTRFYIIVCSLIAAFLAGVFFIINAAINQPGTVERPIASLVLTPPDPTVILPGDTPSATESQTVTPTTEEQLSADLVPQAIQGKTDAATLNITTKIMNAGQEVDSFTREQPISFGSGKDYTTLEGVITFRGNNYRDSASWGTATIIDERLEKIREPKQTGSMGTVKSWGGMGWTGQPLVVKWPDKTRQNMTSLYDQFRNKSGFTEVILCSLDGHIYFEELETGEKTRDPIEIGAPTKGTASLDPRGFPIIYVGQGLQSDGDPNKSNNMYYRAFSLIDGKKYELWGASTKDPFAYRDWQAYDSSALIDAKTDTLIEPGENGVLYTMKLNTDYNEEAGTLTIDPGPLVKYKYTTPRNESTDTWGTENSAVAWRNYVMYTDNIGILQCVDLNTMQLVYANDMGNDSDVSMILEEDPANSLFYLYTGCEYDDTVAGKDGGDGQVYARKINGLTGEIIWTSEPFTVRSPKDGVDGGILASPVLGKDGTSMAGLVIYNVSQEVKGDTTTSELVAFDKLTGKTVWHYDMDAPGWSPSSPVPVYTEDGRGYLIQCDVNGDIALLKVDRQSCQEVDVLHTADTANKVYNHFEASPVVFGNYIVVGSRSNNLFFIKIK